MALPELFTNSPTPGTREALTTLSAELKTGETTMKWTVAPPTPLHGPGQFRVIIGSEIILCEAGSSTTVKILERKAESSTEANHTNGTSIYAVPTTEGLRLYTQGLGFEKSVAIAYAAAEVTGLKGENKVPINTVVQDPGGHFGANAFYTVPSTGYYLITGVAGLKTASESITITKIRVSGTEQLEGNRVVSKAGSYTILTVSGILFLSAAEKIELYTYVEVGEASKLSQTGSCDVLSVMRVGEGPEGKEGPAGAVSSGKAPLVVAGSVVEIEKEKIIAENIKAETITGGKLVNATITGKQVAPGKPEALKELKENIEIEPSSTEATTVYLSLKCKAESTAFEILADGVAIYQFRTETLTAVADNIHFCFRLPKAAKFEVKMTTGKIESSSTTASVYSFQTG